MTDRRRGGRQTNVLQDRDTTWVPRWFMHRRKGQLRHSLRESRGIINCKQSNISAITSTLCCWKCKPLSFLEPVVCLKSSYRWIREMAAWLGSRQYFSVEITRTKWFQYLTHKNATKRNIRFTYIQTDNLPTISFNTHCNCFITWNAL